jgi:hypothetical protein
MAGISLVLFLISLCCLILGVIRPTLVVRWGKRSRKTAFFTYSLTALASLILMVACIGASGISTDQMNTSLAHQEPVKTSPARAEEPIDPDNPKQMWAIKNINMGNQLGLDYLVEKLGRSESVRVTRYNPHIIKAYYFQDANITIFLNTHERSVSHWRIGRASE